MTWDYRVVRSEGDGDEFETGYSVNEVFYDDTGRAYATCVAGAEAADSLEDLRDMLTQMLQALEKPVLDDCDIVPTVWPLDREEPKS